VTRLGADLVAERVTGESLGALVKTQILDPVGLKHTSYPTTSALPAPLTHGYLSEVLGPPRDVTLSNPAVAGGAGAMISTVADLMTWARELAGGTIIGTTLQALRRS
jgi:D-alanyl-D-alanine carboxypeptidase